MQGNTEGCTDKLRKVRRLKRLIVKQKNIKHTKKSADKQKTTKGMPQPVNVDTGKTTLKKYARETDNATK